jgi:hypothetical protein
MKYICIDPSGTGTTGIFFYDNVYDSTNLEVDSKVKYTFLAYKSGDWQEHLEFIIQLVKV